jgi:hypothetical protein
MELKNYTTSEIINSVKQNPKDFQYAVFYPTSIFGLYREISFIDKTIKSRIEAEDKIFKMIEQAYKGLTKGFNKFLSFKDIAYEFSYSSNDFGDLSDLLGELFLTKSLLPLTWGDKKKYSAFFKPLVNRDILYSEQEFQNIARNLDINFESEYTIIFTRINKDALLNNIVSLPDKTYPTLEFAQIAELGELTLYPDGQLYENDRLIHPIDKHQGDYFEFIKYLMTRQKVLTQKVVRKGDIESYFGLKDITNLLNNSNKPFLEKRSNYAVKRDKKGFVWIGFSKLYIDEMLKK